MASDSAKRCAVSYRLSPAKKNPGEARVSLFVPEAVSAEFYVGSVPVYCRL